ncbi:MAG: hypothetical protein A2218_06795 [Elusimicrobia bacterium RIFOXYA2_FULL_53_38]|nr:MAG: hypothetical protein A2218_06795 [Elusimicrobia bacterium RIFOXYA2_FULL_53_38]
MKKHLYTAFIIISASVSGWTLTINGLPAEDIKIPEAAAPTAYKSSSYGRSTYTFEMRVPKGSESDAGAKTLKALKEAGMEAVAVETRPGMLVLKCTGEKLIREWFGSGNTGSLDEYPGQYFNYAEAETAMNAAITRLQKLGKPVIYSFVGGESDRPYFIVYFLSEPVFPKTEKPESIKRVFTEGDSGRIFTAAMGSTIRIEPRDNAASTGYKWGFEEPCPGMI